MLDDKIINLAQSYLAEQFPQFQGFQDTLLASLKQKKGTALKSIEYGKDSIQIHFNFAVHWVTSASISNKVYLFDSLNMELTSSLKKQIVKCYTNFIITDTDTGKELLKLIVVPIMQQKGVVDCGLFAIAFATELCFGKKIEKINYIKFDQEKMRDHLVLCLKQKNFTRFPKVLNDDTRKIKFSKGKIYELYPPKK